MESPANCFRASRTGAVADRQTEGLWFVLSSHPGRLAGSLAG